MELKKLNSRNRILIGIVFAIFVLFGINLFRLQVVNADSSGEKAVKASTVKVEAARGEMYDRNGKLLVTNKQINSLIFEADYFPGQKEMESRVEIIDSLIKLFEERGEEWNDDLPIKIKNGKARFIEDKESDISYLKSKDFLNLNEYATAENCLDALISRYGLEEYSKKQARKIASVCYGMKRNLFSSSNPYTFSDEVSNELIATIKENSEFYRGVDVKIVTQREYIDGSIAPHIIGVVGAISAEEYKEKKDEGYSMTANIGKSGIEKKFESYLKGTDGEKSVVVKADGTKESVYTKNPINGGNLILAIDYDTQKTAQDSLEYLVTEKLKDVRSYQLVGSVVVQDIESGDVIASASYPTYDLDTYWEKAGELNTDKLSPLWNRAIQSTYTPGSTMKLAVAMAGLEEGIITGSSYSVSCKHIYNYYSDYKPKCLGYHGSQNVVNAIYNSCNIFFYEVSRLLGISKLNEYSTMFGLGTKTGVELNESEGTLDSIDSRAAKGETWTPGLTLQAGIGHGNNQFTPMQLCSYVATVARKGTRLSAHYVKSIMSSDFSQTLYKTETQTLSQADFSATSWKFVEEGMRKVGDHYFKNAVVPVCAKTGTTTVNKTINGKTVESNNGILVCYAPANDPEIAISIVIEGASGGASTASLAVDIINEYFGNSDKVDTQQKYQELIG